MYGDTVFLKFKKMKLEGFGSSHISVTILAYPPDQHRRDLDNLCKVLLDSLQWAGAYQDDCQVDRITIQRKEVIKHGGMVKIEIEEL